MKKTNFKAFTLVEMLIVIVIIGILIAALLPRLQGAQAMARDTARQTALTTIGTAIAAYQLQAGHYPLQALDGTLEGALAASGVASTADIAKELKEKGIVTDVPADRTTTNEVWGIARDSDDAPIVVGNFLYALLTKNNTKLNGFMLMAHTEMPGSSNRVVCDEGTNTGSGYIIAPPLNDKGGSDMSTLTLCSSVDLGQDNECTPPTSTNSQCKAHDSSELRYVYMY
ncbi:hypothetical protein AGMMS50249_3400 [candidate division SR1 bacterium]|nr:hypothetical protein AGMMS50249_3400 [candidate division SR1 bacterium]